MHRCVLFAREEGGEREPTFFCFLFGAQAPEGLGQGHLLVSLTNQPHWAEGYPGKELPSQWGDRRPIPTRKLLTRVLRCFEKEKERENCNLLFAFPTTSGSEASVRG